MLYFVVVYTIYMRIYAYICVYIRIYAYICVYMRIYAYIYAYICVYMRISMRIISTIRRAYYDNDRYITTGITEDLVAAYL